jgi:hypothetical protein
VGFADGTIKILVRFRGRKEFQDYLMANQIPCDYDWMFSTFVVDQIRVLFQIISKNNTLDQQSLSKLQSIVDRGCCDPVSPSALVKTFPEKSPKVPSFNQERVLSLLTCPFQNTLMIDAVNLLPCCHKVSQISAKTLKICNVCSHPVIAYSPDYTLQDLVTRIAGHEKKLNLAPLQPAYPGLPAVFALVKENWNKPYKDYSTTSPLCREMEFLSVTKGSLLKSLSLLGYWNGEVKISISTFSGDTKPFEQLLKSHELSCGAVTFHYISKTHEELKTLFRIVALNNQIPFDYFDQIRAIVEWGSCEALPKIIGNPERDLLGYYW